MYTCTHVHGMPSGNTLRTQSSNLFLSGGLHISFGANNDTSTTWCKNIPKIDKNNDRFQLTCGGSLMSSWICCFRAFVLVLFAAEYVLGSFSTSAGLSILPQDSLLILVMFLTWKWKQKCLKITIRLLQGTSSHYLTTRLLYHNWNLWGDFSHTWHHKWVIPK